MLLIAAASLAASHASLPPPRGGAVVQARATVRVLKGARVRFARDTETDGAVVRQTRLTIDGAQRPARLIEFE
ncbi:MAG TPA: hypothetical protein VFP57_08180 [Sphingomicrobium sp.]|jgi:hypothetical protein|nr:hypothetical protein [Sphingomicrobium sp.]